MNASPKVLENLDSLDLPKDAKGLRVLDIGCRDGYFAFELGLHLQKADLCTKAVRNYFFAYKRVHTSARKRQYTRLHLGAC